MLNCIGVEEKACVLSFVDVSFAAICLSLAIKRRATRFAGGAEARVPCLKALFRSCCSRFRSGPCYKACADDFVYASQFVTSVKFIKQPRRCATLIKSCCLLSEGIEKILNKKM